MRTSSIMERCVRFWESSNTLNEGPPDMSHKKSNGIQDSNPKKLSRHFFFSCLPSTLHILIIFHEGEVAKQRANP